MPAKAGIHVLPSIVFGRPDRHGPQPSLGRREAMRGGWVYIMTNKPFGALYIGVTSDIAARVWQHRNGKGSAFCKRYGLATGLRRGTFDHLRSDRAREGDQGVESQLEIAADHGSKPRL